jgi:hypothetical protein
VSEVESLLRRIVAALQTANVDFMIAGSFASSMHGMPRTTNDLDIVIDVTPATLEALLKQFPAADYYVDADAARDALRRRSQFNLIDMATGWKVDFIVRRARSFSTEEFERRVPSELLGVAVFVATAEDTIIAKLEWAKMSASEKQLRDVRGILDVRGASLDLAYVERWVAELGLTESFEAARRLMASD